MKRSSADGRWKGEMLNHEHTPVKGEKPGIRRL